MIMIELDAFDAFIDSLDAMNVYVSPRDIGLALRRLYNDGWQITRIPPIEPVSEPSPAAAPVDETWPPVGLATRLWATGMRPHPDHWIEISFSNELLHAVDDNASLIGADNLSDAQAYWRDRGDSAPDAEFVVNGVTFRYYSDLIPF